MTTQHSTRADGALETSTMTAITQHRYGGPEVLGLDTLPVPTPGPAEVLVKVHARLAVKLQRTIIPWG